MRQSFLAFSPPSIGQDEIDEVIDTLRSAWITTGPKTRRFEDEFAALAGVPHALAVNSCTAAMHLALAAWGVGQGDEVITTPYTFCSTVNVVLHQGARPVLVDVCDGDLTLDPDRLEAAITPRTRVVLPVHLGGQPCRMDDILAIAARYGLKVLEDAAHATGATYRGRPVGNLGDATAFSFYATKNLTTAEGGMLTTADAELADRTRLLALHGMSRDAWKRYGQDGAWHYDVVAPGFKYNMTDIQASLGLHQLRRLPVLQARRAAVAARYTAGLADLTALRLPVARPEVEHAWHLYVIRVQPGAIRIDRAAMIEELHRRNIGTSVHFIPLNHHPYYQSALGWRPGQFPVAEAAYAGAISLPLHPGLSDGDVDDVIDAVRDVVTHFAT
ncbi:MAG: DegT/DnrJ/EryC1/StrS family aminotransferase [Chloroflexi bacterium]|nr:DegT/DnrJ/EryC1/StrS family aminotransferase [Chloroflexota bacterium]